MPSWGRPSGRRERERERWERHQQQVPVYDDYRVREVSSDEDRLLISQKRRSVLDSDELFFNDGGSRYPRTYSNENLAYGEAYGSERSSSEEEEGALVVMSRTQSEEQELVIARRALQRIDRAKAQGKPAVTLTHEEIEALEQRYSRESPDRERKRTSPKEKRSPSLNNGAWTRKSGSRRSSLLAPAADAPKQRAIAAPKQRSSKPGKRRDPRDEEIYAQPPGFMVQSPGGTPVHTPLGYAYTDRAPPVRRTVSGEKRYSPPESRGSSRSSSSTSRHVPQQAPAPYPYYDDARPTSRPASFQDEYAYAQYQTHGPIVPPLSRRGASGPPEVSYSTVYRRVPVPSTHTSSRSRMQPSSSEPNMHRPSPIANEYEPSSATSEEDDSEEELAIVAPPVRVTRAMAMARDAPATRTGREEDKGRRRRR